MRPIFTIHAGEYLVGCLLEEQFPHCHIWVPTKDTGVDLLITNPKTKKATSVQVKFSKDYSYGSWADTYRNDLVATGWWALNLKKMESSVADFWIMALLPHRDKGLQAIVIEPRVFRKRLLSLHGHHKTVQSYLWVTANKRCYETRGFRKAESSALVMDGKCTDPKRDFSPFLNNFVQIREWLS